MADIYDTRICYPLGHYIHTTLPSRATSVPGSHASRTYFTERSKAKTKYLTGEITPITLPVEITSLPGSHAFQRYFTGRSKAKIKYSSGRITWCNSFDDSSMGRGAIDPRRFWYNEIQNCMNMKQYKKLE